MAHISDLTPEVRVELPDCPSVMINRYLVNTVRDFCWQTYYWQQEMTPISLLPMMEQVPDSYLYSLPVPTVTELITVRELLYEGEPLRMRSQDWLDNNLPGWRSLTGDPKYYLMMSDKLVRFVPGSDRVQPGAITGTLVLRPAKKASQFGDCLLDFDQALVCGCLSRMMLMANRPWSNERRAATCAMAYAEGISQAKYRVLKGFSEGAETVERRTWG